MSLSTDLVRNVAITGHGSTGKTTLLEHILFTGDAIPRPETIESGKTVSDYQDEEIQRKISIHATLSHISLHEKKINFIDTPGSSDFIGEVILAFRSCELAVVLLDGRSGVQIETIKSWRNLSTSEKPRVVFVSRLDEERSDYAKSLDDVKEKFKVSPVAITIPMGEGASFKGVIDVLSRKAYSLPASHDQKETASEIPAEFKEKADEARLALAEAAAEGDDALMEKYLTEGSLSDQEIVKGLKSALASNKVVPAFAGSGLKNSGVAALIEFIAEIGPSPLSLAPEPAQKDGKELLVSVDPSKPFSGFVIKTQIDQFSGRLSFIKVITGKLAPDIEVYVSRDGKKEKIGKLYTVLGKKIEEVKEVVAGDIGIVTKALSFKTNDTIIAAGEPSFAFPALKLPAPVHMVAISAVSKKEDDKLSELLYKAAEEDHTFSIAFNGETHETVIGGMGELQINMILDRIRHQQKIEMETRIPRVAYRETIQKKSGAEYTHKKQTGGHGQYGKVVLEIDPLERGKKYVFENAVFGGAVSKGFIPGIEKGIHQAMENGVLAGYPVVDVLVRLTDGKEHPVDSSEMSFKLAARGAFKESMKTANPVILEPIMNLTVFAEEKYLGDVMSDLSGKRGRISGQQPIGGGIDEIKAQVPQAELLRYAIDLRSLTSGTGSFEVEFDHYSPITGKIAEEVIKAAQAFKKEVSEDE
jgi:elongation factor G